MVALMRLSNSSSPRIASCKWRGVIRLTFKSLEAFPANSKTCTERKTNSRSKIIEKRIWRPLGRSRLWGTIHYSDKVVGRRFLTVGARYLNKSFGAKRRQRRMGWGRSGRGSSGARETGDAESAAGDATSNGGKKVAGSNRPATRLGCALTQRKDDRLGVEASYKKRIRHSDSLQLSGTPK